MAPGLPQPGRSLRLGPDGRLGAYGVDDSNVFPGGVQPTGAPYNERTLFNAEPPPAGDTPPGATAIHQVGNVNGPTAPYPFSASAKSQQIIGANPERSYLFVQNLSTYANLYVNLGFDAAMNGGILLQPSQSYTWDQFCPTSAVYVYFDSGTTVQPGFALEGTDQ